MVRTYTHAYTNQSPHIFRIAGFVVPILTVILLILGHSMTALSIATFLILPYLIDIRPQPWLCRLYMRWGSQYFDGGSTLIRERKPDTVKDAQLPIMAACHPHGNVSC